MTRTIASAMLTDIAASNATAFWFFELQVSSGTLNWSTLSHDISWDSKTWTGIGGELTFSGMQEDGTLFGAGVQLRVSGVDTTLVDAIVADDLIGREASIWLAHLSAGAIVADPIEFGPWLMNNRWEITDERDGGGTVTVSTTLSSPLAILRRVRGIVSNLQSHQQQFSTDTFFNKVAKISARPAPLWGADAPIRGGGFPPDTEGEEPGDSGGSSFTPFGP